MLLYYIIGILMRTLCASFFLPYHELLHMPLTTKGGSQCDASEHTAVTIYGTL